MLKYGCNSDMDMYQKLVNSANLNFAFPDKQDEKNIKAAFYEMPRANRKAMVKAMFTIWGGVSDKVKLFFFDLL